jgi:hypothetical protein
MIVRGTYRTIGKMSNNRVQPVESKSSAHREARWSKRGSKERGKKEKGEEKGTPTLRDRGLGTARKGTPTLG